MGSVTRKNLRSQRSSRLLSAAEVAERLGVSIHSIYTWTKRYGVPKVEREAQDAQSDEMRRLKAELTRVTEERDILKKAAIYFAKTSG